jgi:hypothetical protein
MDPEVVTLRPRSRAEYAALTALLDLGELIAESPIQVERTRVIGGQMVGLHVARYRLEQTLSRMTLDTDFGLDVSTLSQLGPVERFADKHYHLREGHRFCRQLGEENEEAVVDVLIPNYTSHPGSYRQVGAINSFQTPGLAELLRREPMLLRLRVEFDSGEVRETVLATTDECGALFSKVLAWDDRRRKTNADKDAFDVWRSLEVCYRANIGPGSWPEQFDASGWKQLIRDDFGTREADGSKALASYVHASGGNPEQAVTRTIALVSAVVGRS